MVKPTSEILQPTSEQCRNPFRKFRQFYLYTTMSPTFTLFYNAQWRFGFTMHDILAYNGRKFPLPHFHFQYKSVNISTILTSKLRMCVYVWRLDSWLSFRIYISWVEFSVNKQVHLNCLLFLHWAIGVFDESWDLLYCFKIGVWPWNLGIFFHLKRKNIF